MGVDEWDMVLIEKTFEIKAPTEKIWNIIADRRRIPELQPNVLQVNVDPPGLAVPGQEFRFVYKVWGRKVKVVGNHVEAVPNKLLRSEHRPGGMFETFGDTMKLETSSNGTQVTTILEYELAMGAFGKFLGWLFVNRAIRNDAANYWRNVRRLAESSTYPPKAVVM